MAISSFGRGGGRGAPGAAYNFGRGGGRGGPPPRINFPTGRPPGGYPADASFVPANRQQSRQSGGARISPNPRGREELRSEARIQERGDNSRSRSRDHGRGGGIYGRGMNPNRLGAIGRSNPSETSRAIANRDKWNHRAEMRDEESEDSNRDSRNRSLMNRRQGSNSSSSAAADSSVPHRGYDRVNGKQDIVGDEFEEELQDNNSGDGRYVNFQDNANVVIDLENTCIVCGEIHADKYINQEPMPGELAAPFVGAAVPGGGFFVIPDIRNAAPVREIFQAVIVIKEGNPSGREIEDEFSQWAGDRCTWRWYAKPLTASSFLMRFPSSRDIDAWVHFGRVHLRTKPSVAVKVDHWTPEFGASGELDVAWFQVKGIPLVNRNCPTATFVGSLVGRTLLVDKHSLNNVEYVRMMIGNMDVSVVPPVVPYVNIGGSFYDIEFTREIKQSKQGKNSVTNKEVKVSDDQNPTSGPHQQTPKRTRSENDTNNNRMVGHNSAPGSFMRDARISYGTSYMGQTMKAGKNVEEASSRGKRKVIEVYNDDSDNEESFSAQIHKLGYNPNHGQEKMVAGNEAGSSSHSVVSQALDLYKKYLTYLASPKLITDGVVGHIDVPAQDKISYEDFLRKLLTTSSDKTGEWKEKLDKVSGADGGPLVESPITSEDNSAGHSDSVSPMSLGEGGERREQQFNVQITEISSSPVSSGDKGVDRSSESVPPFAATPAQPVPIRVSKRNQENAQKNLQVYKRASEYVAKKNGEGMQKGGDKQTLEEGADRIQELAVRMQGANNNLQLRLENEEPDEEMLGDA